MERRQFLRSTAVAGGVAGTFSRAATASRETYETVDRRVPSFDGTEIASTVFLPGGSGRHPVVMATHGWGGDRSSVADDGEFFAKRGYVVVTWDQRGFGESEGEVDVSGPKESRDVSALIDFLLGEVSDERITSRVAAPGGDPAVGMIGASYGGGIQLNASAIDDRIDALVPVIPWHDLRFSLAPDDVPKLGWDTLLQAVGVTGARGLTSGDGRPDQGDVERGVNTRLHEFYAKATAFNEMPEEAESYFAVRSTVSKAREITADALVIQGWPDTLFVPNEGQRIVRDLNDNGRDNEAKLVVYNGGHTLVGNGGTKAFGLPETALQWFDAKLTGAARDRGTPDDGFAPVSYYDVQAGATADESSLADVSAADSPLFREADAFPPTAAEPVDLPFAAAAGEGSTVIANSVAPTSASQVVPPNGDAAPGATAATFDFPVSGPVELATTPALTLRVDPIGTQAFLFAKASHVSGGTATLINNQVQPTAFEGTPGTATTVEVEMVSFHRRFEAGDALRVTLATTDAGFNGARQSTGVRIHHGDSAVRVHALDGAADLDPS